MADDGDLHKLHGLLEAMLGEQVHLGRSLDLHLQNAQGGRFEENGHLSEDEKMQSILRHLQGVETEGSKLKHDLQILTASQHGLHLTEAYDEQLERLKEDVVRMAHTQQETETHLTELGHVLSACLAGLGQRSPAPNEPAVGAREAELAAEVEATHKALQEERARNAELAQTIASLQQAAEEGRQAKSTLEKAVADGADEAKRATTARLKLQADLEEAERALKKERKLATKAKKRHDEENKKNMATFKELRKEQFGQLAALEGQVEGLRQELAGERVRSQGAQEQAAEARLAYEQKERELQEMLRLVREEAAARAGTRESEMATRLAELEAQLTRRSEEQEAAAVSASAAAAQRSDEDREAHLRERDEEMRKATEEWERERGEREARVEALTAQLAQAREELAQLKAAMAELEERARLAEERAAVAERTLTTATAEWAERQGQSERLYAEQGAALSELGARLAAFEERLPEIESRAVRQGREEVQGDLDRLQAEHALLSSQLKQTEKEARAYKAEAEALRNELAQASQKPAGAAPAQASHPGVQTRRRLEPEMRAAADVSSPAAAPADHDTRKVRRRSEADKEQDITDLLQSDDVVQTRPRTMPATASGQSLPAATGDTAAPADHRTDPVEYLSEELALYVFSRLSARDLLSLTRVNRKYRRIASDASLWRPKCQRLWHFHESEGSAYTDTDWKEVYLYRHTHYKQVSCVIVGDENVGKKTLITAFEGMVTQKGWKRGQERERCTVCVESLFGVPTMFHLTVLKANPPDPCSDLMHHLADHLTRTKADVFLLCVPASGSIEATKSRLDALESKVLPALDALCPDVPRILVGTETDIKEEHYDHSHPTAIPMSFSNFVERHHCHAAVLTSAMSNRHAPACHPSPSLANLVELFDMAQSLVPTPNLRVKVSHDQVVVMNQTIRSKERKPPRSTALGPRASTQYGHPDAMAPLPTPLQTSPSSPRRQGGAPARGAASPYVAPATPSPSTPYGGRGGPSATPYTPYGASSALFTPSPSTPADGPPLSPYLYNQPVSQSAPLPAGAGSPLGSAASTGPTTPGSTTRNWRRLRSSASDTPRSQRDNKCALQ